MSAISPSALGSYVRGRTVAKPHSRVGRAQVAPVLMVLVPQQAVEMLRDIAEVDMLVAVPYVVHRS